MKSVTLTVILTFWFLLNLSYYSNAKTVDKILVTIDDEFITLTDYMLFLKREGYTPQDSINEGFLKELIEERLILKEAKRRGVTVTDKEIEEMTDEMARQRGISRDKLIADLKEEGRGYKDLLRDRIIYQRVINDEVDSKVLVSERDIEEFYAGHKDHFRLEPEMVEIETLFMVVPPDASITEITELKLKSLKIIRLLKEGGDFEGIARRYGEFKRLGRFERGALLSPLNEITFSLKEGEISNPVWTVEGVYVIRVVKRLEATYRPLGDVRDQIYTIIYDKKRSELLNNFLKRLWEAASIRINY